MNSTNVIERSILIAANREKVWQAITTPEHFSKWFEADIRFNKLAVGEVMTFDVSGQSGFATIAIVEPPERFAYHWTPELGNSTQTLVTFFLEVVPDGTCLTVTEAGFEALPDEIRQRRYTMNAEGWGIQVKNVAAYVQSMSDDRK